MDTDHGRKYRHPLTGEEWPSVTTILEGGVPKPGLAKWSAKEAAKCAWELFHGPLNFDEQAFIKEASESYERISEEAAAKGDMVHESVERFLNGEDDGLSPKHLVQLRRFLDISEYRVLHTEVTVINRRYGYAGTVDLIASTPTGIAVIDYKTGKGVWPEAMLQVEALAGGEHILYPDGTELRMPPIDEVGVLHLRPLSWWYHRNRDLDSFDRNWKAWLGAVEVAKWRMYHPSLIFPEERMNEKNWTP